VNEGDWNARALKWETSRSEKSSPLQPLQTLPPLRLLQLLLLSLSLAPTSSSTTWQQAIRNLNTPTNYNMLAIDDYPPVPAHSYRQDGQAVFLGANINPSQYRSLTFSDSFLEKYGQPTLYYSDFNRLMTTHVNPNLFPRYRKAFAILADTLTFLDFCGQVDQIAIQNSLPVLGRKEMEAAWAQLWVIKYEKLREEDVLKLKQERPRIKDEAAAREFLKSLLNKAVERVSFCTKIETWLTSQ